MCEQANVHDQAGIQVKTRQTNVDEIYSASEILLTIAPTDYLDIEALMYNTLNLDKPVSKSVAAPQERPVSSLCPLHNAWVSSYCFAGSAQSFLPQ